MVKNRGILALVVTLPLAVLALLLLLAFWTVERRQSGDESPEITMPPTAPRASDFQGPENQQPDKERTSSDRAAESTYTFGNRGRSNADNRGALPVARAPGDERSVTFLLVGRHGENTDTLMLGRLDSRHNRMAVLSIPRDLYINGRRINRVYAEQGIRALVEQVEWMTGISVDHYLETDMSAFVDTVNLLGGIEVDVEEPLLDPTYAALEGRSETAVWLDPGRHRLDGLRALRYVRSRQTTSDFDRARRQQQVLRALRERATNLTFRDIATIARVTAHAMRSVETDLSIGEVLHLLKVVRTVKTVRGTVLDTDNVLTATYSAVYGTNQSAEHLPEERRGAWILVPDGGDWAAIRRYTQAFFQQEIPATGS